MKVKFIVIDTLARASVGADENSAKDVGAIIKTIDHIREKCGAHVMLVHHSGKDTSKGARGSSALLAAADTAILLEKFKATVTKLRDGETGEKFTFSLASVDIGPNSEWEPITVPSVCERESIVEIRPLTGQKKLAFELLQQISGSGGGRSTRPNGKRHLCGPFPGKARGM